MTGSGKTEIINRLSPLSIDLEGLAGHRSSLFGHVGLAPRQQKMFENLIHEELTRVNSFEYIYFEGESKKIGNINIPQGIFDRMLSGTIIKVHADLEFRVARIVAEYFDSEKKIREVGRVLESHVLKNRLGMKTVEYMKDCLAKEDYDELVEVLLVKYYDPSYNHSQKRLKASVELHINSIDDIVEKIKNYVKEG